MSRRLSGINPLSYLGVEPYTPPAMLKNGRTPTNNDFANPGDFWLVIPPGYSGPESLHVLVSLNAGIATWAQLWPASSGGASEFETDSGSVVPALGIVNVLGDGVKINTTGSGNTIVIHSDSDVANEYPTDSGTAIPSSNELNILGGSNINTSGSSNTVTINLDTNVTIPGNLFVETDTFLEGNLTIVPLSTGVLQSNGSGEISSSAGTNGQLLIGSTAGAPAWANLTSTGATVTITNNANSINLETAGGSGGNTIISQFTSSGTWTKNGSTQYVEVYAVCAGGGGASGSVGATNQTSTGGGGGGNWGTLYLEGPALCFAASHAITVGAGGAGGASVSSPTTSGALGENGGTSSFEDMTTVIATTPGERRNGGGQIGTIEGASFPGYYGDIARDRGLYVTGSNLYVGSQYMSPGNGGSLQNGFKGRNGIGASLGRYQQGVGVSLTVYGSYLNSGTGGGGAGRSTAAAEFLGGDGGSIRTFGASTLVAGGSGGLESGTLDGGNGGDGLQGVGVINFGAGGGGGGNQFVGARGGNGGNGGFPGGGGGGGGAAKNGSSSGAGGNGADGIVIVIEYL